MIDRNLYSVPRLKILPSLLPNVMSIHYKHKVSEKSQRAGYWQVADYLDRGRR
jgi:hypothetical protein